LAQTLSSWLIATSDAFTIPPSDLPTTTTLHHHHKPTYLALVLHINNGWWKREEYRWQGQRREGFGCKESEIT
jgi:hypothetical protein